MSGIIAEPVCACLQTGLGNHTIKKQTAKIISENNLCVTLLCVYIRPLVVSNDI